MPRSSSCTRTASTSCRWSEKTLVWHLYRAALAGRDIYYDQRYRHNLRHARHARGRCISHPDGIPDDVLAEITRYTKLFWMNTGPYNNLTARKFLLNLDRQRVIEATLDLRGGQRRRLPLQDGETIGQARRALRADVLRSRRSIRW